MAQISIRVEDSIKEGAESIFETIGLSTSSAINIFLRTVAREKRIPFELTADPFYSKANMDELKRRIDDIKSGRAILKEHDLIEV